MPAKLSTNRYGKSRVRVVRVTKHEATADAPAFHDLDEWNVQILLAGDFETAHTLGDNSKVLPTDTMKNTVYYVAHNTTATSIEEYAKELIDYILTRQSAITSAEVVIHSTLWKRLTVDGKPYPYAFMRGSNERQTATVSRTQTSGFSIVSGVEQLTVLKTTESEFTGYIKDSLTTLPETTDRIFATELKSTWTYTPEAIASAAASSENAIDFNKVRHHLREVMISTFAKHYSLSVQQTLYAMGEAALDHTDIISEVYLIAPNKHCLLINFAPFGQTNPNHIFVPTDEPHGTIEATITRA